MPLSMEKEPDGPTGGQLGLSATGRPGPSDYGTSDDGTGQLLRWGAWTLAVGVLAALLTKFVFGGIGEQGPHTNSGWMALIVAMMCLPFGSMLALLGGAKWLRNRRTARQPHPRR